jgi:hypothetical protein
MSDVKSVAIRVAFGCSIGAPPGGGSKNVGDRIEEFRGGGDDTIGDVGTTSYDVGVGIVGMT